MESQKLPLYELPVPSTDSVTDAWLTLRGRIAVLRFDYYRDEKPYRSAIRFDGVVATRTRSERCCTVWHIADAYDYLVEVIQSKWVESQIADLPEMYCADFTGRHFMIYLDSVGCFELLADNYEVLQEESGSWESLRVATGS